MSHFEYSSAYYNLLYNDKDYRAEAEYIHQLILQYSADTKSLLNLGCGTGKHDFELADMGYSVTGVDVSSEMIDIARESNNRGSGVEFLQADIRNVRLPNKFNAVISMFNVLGYQTSNEDMIAAFGTAKFHLNPGGLLIFDIWHSPAVYKHPPEVRIKRLSDTNYKITRIAEPKIDENNNVIEVNYEILIEELNNNSPNRIAETHHVRHFSIPEIKLFAKHCGFEVIRAEEFLTSKQPNSDSWGITYILKRDETF